MQLRGYDTQHVFCVIHLVAAHRFAPSNPLLTQATATGPLPLPIESNTLPAGRRCRCHARQDELDFSSFAGHAIETEPAAQITRDDAVDDMQTEASAALI